MGGRLRNACFHMHVGRCSIHQQSQVLEAEFFFFIFAFTFNIWWRSLLLLLSLVKWNGTGFCSGKKQLIFKMMWTSDGSPSISVRSACYIYLILFAIADQRLFFPPAKSLWTNIHWLFKLGVFAFILLASNFLSNVIRFFIFSASAEILCWSPETNLWQSKSRCDEKNSYAAYTKSSFFSHAC